MVMQCGGIGSISSQEQQLVMVGGVVVKTPIPINRVILIRIGGSCVRGRVYTTATTGVRDNP